MKADLALFLCIPATLIAVELVLALRFRSVLSRWMAVMQSSTKLMGDKSLSDDDKQEQLAKAAGQTLLGTFKIFAIIVIALAGFVIVYGLAISVFRIDSSLPQTIVRPEVQIGSVIAAIIWLWVRARVFR